MNNYLLMKNIQNNTTTTQLPMNSKHTEMKVMDRVKKDLVATLKKTMEMKVTVVKKDTVFTQKKATETEVMDIPKVAMDTVTTTNSLMM